MQGDTPVDYQEYSEFKVISTEPDTVMNYQQYMQDAKDGKTLHAENGFWRIFPEIEGTR